MEQSIYDFIEATLAADNEDDEDRQPVNDKFAITNDAAAEKALWYYKKLNADIAALQQQAHDYVKEAERTANAFLAKNCKPKEDYKEILEQRLLDFAQKETAERHTKSIKLLNGTLSFVKQQPKYERDEEIIIDYIHSIKDMDNSLQKFLKPQPDKLDWAALKKEGSVQDIDGTKKLVVGSTIIPSVTVIEQDRSFKIK